LLAKPTPRNVNLGSDRFAMFNKERDIPTMMDANTFFLERFPGAMGFAHRLGEPLFSPLRLES
jgi:hypothetical protein